MRVCDITREDEVTSAFTIVQHDPSVSIEDYLGNAGDEVGSMTVIETGPRATAAMEKKDWTELGKLVPYSLRPKNPKRAEGAKKAQATKAAKAAAAAQAQGTQSATNGSTQAAGAPAAAGQAAAPTATKTPATA